MVFLKSVPCPTHPHEVDNAEAHPGRLDLEVGAQFGRGSHDLVPGLAAIDVRLQQTHACENKKISHYDKKKSLR